MDSMFTGGLGFGKPEVQTNQPHQWIGQLSDLGMFKTQYIPLPQTCPSYVPGSLTLSVLPSSRGSLVPSSPELHPPPLLWLCLLARILLRQHLLPALDSPPRPHLGSCNIHSANTHYEPAKGQALFGSGHRKESTTVSALTGLRFQWRKQQKQENRQTSYEFCPYFKGNKTGLRQRITKEAHDSLVWSLRATPHIALLLVLSWCLTGLPQLEYLPSLHPYLAIQMPHPQETFSDPSYSAILFHTIHFTLHSYLHICILPTRL